MTFSYSWGRICAGLLLCPSSSTPPTDTCIPHPAAHQVVQGLPLVWVLQQSHFPLWVSRACLSRHSCSSCLSWRNCYVEEMDIRLTSAQEEPAACRVRALAFLWGSVRCIHSPPADWSSGDPEMRVHVFILQVKKQACIVGGRYKPRPT